MNQQQIEVLKKLKKLTKKSDAFVDSVPRCLREVVYDNDFSNAQGLMIDVLVNAFFEEFVEDCYWFLYEWKPGKDSVQIVTKAGTEFVIKTENDFYKYLKSQ
jgi:hypothetical protein